MSNLARTETFSLMATRNRTPNGPRLRDEPRKLQWPEVPLFSNGGPPEIPSGDGTLELRLLHQRNELLQRFVDDAPAAFHCIGPDGLIVWANKADIALVGHEWSDYVGHSVREFHADSSLIQAVIGQLAAHDKPVSFESKLVCKNDTVRNVIVHFQPCWEDGRLVYSCGFTQDGADMKRSRVTLRLLKRELELEAEEHADQTLALNARLQSEINRRKQYEDELHLLLEVSHEVASAGNFREALEAALSMICDLATWEAGEAWIPDSRNEVLTLYKSWQKAGQDLGDFLKSRKELHLKTGKGLPGKVLETNQSCWVPDVENCGFFSSGALAKKAGIQSAFAVPVRSNGAIVAILTFFAKSRQDRDQHFVELTASISDQLGNCFKLRQTSDRLTQWEKHLARAQEIARMGSWEWDPEAGQLVFSDALFDLLGISRSSFDGTFENYLKLVHPDDRKKVESAILNAIGGKKQFSHEERLIRPDGQQMVLSAESSLVETETGGTRTIGICQDITERRISELTEHHLASLVQASEDGIIGKTLDGTITSWNSGAETIFGYPANEVVGQSIYLLAPPDRKEEQNHILNRVKRGTGLKQLETVRLRKDGTRINVQVTVSPVRDQDGKTIGAVHIARDITKLKHLETMVLEISEREQRRIGQDIHDGLSQELSAVSYMAHLLRRKLKSKGIPEAEEASRITELLADAGRQTRQVARGLLPVNRQEPGGLAAALRRLVSAIEKTYAIKSWFDGDSKVRINNEMTSTHLYRIAQEATNNAVRHGRASEIGISLKRLKDRIRMVIEDNGVGLPKRVPKSRTRGMGLESMNFRARAVGATLTVKRRNDQGTRVECYLSVARLRRRK